MPRKKQERVAVPSDQEVSRKALQNSEFAYWGPEPTFDDAALQEATKERWNELDKARRIREFNRFADLAGAEWFQLKPAERERIMEWVREWEIGSALNWYNVMTDHGKLKKHFIAYAEEHFPEYVPGLNKTDEDSFHTWGAIARATLRGAKMPEKWVTKIREKAKEWHNAAKNLDEEKAAAPISAARLALQKERDARISELIGMVQVHMDDYGLRSRQMFPEPSMADFLLKNGATNGQRMKVHEFFSGQILEYMQAMNGHPEVAEYYEGVKPNRLKRVYNWLTGQPSTELVQAARKSRKPRKKKEKSAESILKRFEYLKSDTELGLKSIDPEDIISAQQLWVFNVDTRRLGVYHAKDDKGLQIHRKSIANYDEEKSVNKKIRKPKEVVPPVVSMGKVALRKVLDDVNAVATPMKCRISDKVLLLKVVK